MTRLNIQSWKRFLSIARPYWTSEQKWLLRGLLGLLIVLLLAYTHFSVAFNQQLGEFTSALAGHDVGRFWSALRRFVLLLILAAPINSLYYFVRDTLAVRWRRWLTSHFLETYFSNRAYYDLASNPVIDNPDQRISEDISTFTQKSLQFFLIAVNGLMQLVAFSAVLWSISQMLVVFLVAYAAAGTAITIFAFGRVLTALNFWQLRREADFRFSLVRVRENVESIAFYHGEAEEASVVERRFEEAYLNYNKLIRWQFYLSLFQYANTYITYVLPYVILAREVLSGELEVGQVVVAAGAFSASLSALNLVIDNFDNLSRFAAGIDRLDAFAKALKPTAHDHSADAIEVRRGDRIGIDRLTLQTPNRQRTLIKNLNLVVEPGMRLAISGPSGCGKTSLLRAIVGLWNSGTGTIVRPSDEQILFLPQRPYMILGSLRSQLLYPRSETTVSNDRLIEVLKMVNLGHLAECAESLDSELDWSKVLSMGEQQRLSFARLLLIKPKYAILDETTSALDRVNEENLYRLFEGTTTALISVTHHPAVLRYHQQVLELSGDGGWALHPLEDSKVVR